MTSPEARAQVHVNQDDEGSWSTWRPKALEAWNYWMSCWALHLPCWAAHPFFNRTVSPVAARATQDHTSVKVMLVF